jgi:hypothetical protein
MKIQSKLTKVGNNFTVNKYDNGYMIEIYGTDENDNHKTMRICCTDLDQLLETISEFDTIEQTD